MNKVYFFIIDEDRGGVYIAAPNYKEAKLIAIKTEIIQWSVSYNAYIEIRGHMCKKDNKPVFTEKNGELDVEDLNELGLLWWACDNELDNGDYCNGDIFEFLEDGETCRCKECGHEMLIPYSGI